MKKSKVIFKSITKYWFYIGIIIIIIIAILYLDFAIWLTIIGVVLCIISFIPSLFFEKNIVKLMENYYKIEDEMIAQELKRPLEKVQEKMYDLAQSQGNKAWLIVYLNKRYIFYHQEIVKKFI